MKIGTRVKLKHLGLGKDEESNWSLKAGLKMDKVYTVSFFRDDCIRLEGFSFIHSIDKFKKVGGRIPQKLTVQFIPRTRKGKRYFQIKMSKNGNVFNHQYNSRQGAKKSFESLVNDLKNGNFIVK